MRTCIDPGGTFVHLVHQPSYTVRNLRARTRIETLGRDTGDGAIDNAGNYPAADLAVDAGDWIYEIANPFPFRGATYIGKRRADRNAEDPAAIRLPEAPEVSMHDAIAGTDAGAELIDTLPRPLQLALAVTSTDPDDLVRLAHLSCRFVEDGPDLLGLRYRRLASGPEPDIEDHDLFEAVANNPALPDRYKIAMVIRPGAQGNSEIVGDHHDADTHVYEYLRRNSYIAGGHYAANMADDALRYRIADLSPGDMHGLRHLYYQRTYVRLADLLGLDIPARRPLTAADLDSLRTRIIAHPGLAEAALDATLWGWNFGFDFAPSGYRLHASHQQIHQQYAMIPRLVADGGDERTGRAGRPFSAGDMITEAIDEYRAETGRSLFFDYRRAIATNERLDGRADRDRDLVIWQDGRVMLFVPKAQTSQWELQIMTTPSPDGFVAGNLLETDFDLRASLDRALFAAQAALAGRGATMVTTIEWSKRFASTERQQPLIYCLMPKLPWSPGALSETQLRFITGHYPEDFAAACRASLAESGIGHTVG